MKLSFDATVIVICRKLKFELISVLKVITIIQSTERNVSVVYERALRFAGGNRVFDNIL